jgi:predicted DNA-binding transcriptional regulator AlpA
MTTLDTILRNRLIDKKELRRLVPYSDSQIYRMEKQGLFPKRIKLGPAKVVWSLWVVLEWIDSKRQGRVWTADTSSGTDTHA